MDMTEINQQTWKSLREPIQITAFFIRCIIAEKQQFFEAGCIVRIFWRIIQDLGYWTKASLRLALGCKKVCSTEPTSKQARPRAAAV